MFVQLLEYLVENRAADALSGVAKVLKGLRGAVLIDPLPSFRCDLVGVFNRDKAHCSGTDGAASVNVSHPPDLVVSDDEVPVDVVGVATGVFDDEEDVRETVLDSGTERGLVTGCAEVVGGGFVVGLKLEAVDVVVEEVADW